MQFYIFWSQRKTRRQNAVRLQVFSLSPLLQVLWAFFLMIFCVLNKSHVSSVQSNMFMIYELLCVVCVWVQNCEGKSLPCSFFGQHYRPTCEITRFNPCVISAFVFVCCKRCLGTKVQCLCKSSPKFSVCLFLLHICALCCILQSKT